MGVFTLDGLKPYNACVVEKIGSCAANRRLTDLGVTPGTVIVHLFSAPGGEPTAYLIRGSVISLRKSEASAIAVSEVKKADGR